MNDQFQMLVLVTADGRKLKYVGPPHIDPAAPPRPLPVGMWWEVVDRVLTGPAQEATREAT